MHNYNNMTHSTVQMSQIMPTAIMSGSAGFMLTVNGSGFSSKSVVYWNATPLGTQFVSGNQLVAGVPAAEVAMPGTVQVYVSSDGMASNMLKLMVN